MTALRKTLELFETPHEIVGRVQWRGKTVTFAYLSPGIMDIGSLEPPFPPYMRFTNGSAYGAQGREAEFTELPEELAASGVQIYRLYDPRVYLKALRLGAARQTGRRAVLEYKMTDVGSYILGMPHHARDWQIALSDDDYETEFMRRKGELVLRIRNESLEYPPVARYQLPLVATESLPTR